MLKRMESTDYTSIKIPKVLANQIGAITQQLGYRSVSEFVLDCTRRRLEQLQEKIRK